MRTWAMTSCATASGLAAAILASMRPNILISPFLSFAFSGACTRRSTFLSSTTASFADAVRMGVALVVSCSRPCFLWSGINVVLTYF